jgi:hypothetical protein
MCCYVLIEISLRDDYLAAVEGMRDRLLRRTPLSNLTYFGELEHNGNTFTPKMVNCKLHGNPEIRRCNPRTLNPDFKQSLVEITHI